MLPAHDSEPRIVGGGAPTCSPHTIVARPVHGCMVDGERLVPPPSCATAGRRLGTVPRRVLTNPGHVSRPEIAPGDVLVKATHHRLKKSSNVCCRRGCPNRW